MDKWNQRNIKKCLAMLKKQKKRMEARLSILNTSNTFSQMVCLVLKCRTDCNLFFWVINPLKKSQCQYVGNQIMDVFVSA